MTLKPLDYHRTLETVVPRVLMLWNRDPMSPAYGSFDRNFWNFKTLTDFSCATYQQAVLGLSELYVAQSLQTRYASQPMLLEAIRSGVLFWCKIQHIDGSQDEYYQNERSFCATAFTTFAVARTFFRVPHAWSSEERKLIRSKIVRAADWLIRYTNPGVQNQMLVSMNALYWVARVTVDATHKDAFKKRRSEILAAQNPEGWFPEYGGADIGYSFKQLDFLCAYLAEEQDSEVQAAAQRLTEFVVHFLHPDGTAGGSYGSRCTEHVFPFGIEWMSRNGSKEAIIALSWYSFHHAQQSVICPEIVDDKYLTYFYFFSFVQSALLPPLNVTLYEPLHSIGERGLLTWEQAGLARWTDDHHALWVSLKRNGVLRWFYDRKSVSSNSGYEIELLDGSVAATQCENATSAIDFNEDAAGVEINIKGNAAAVDLSLPLIRWMVPFKWFCRTLLRVDLLAIFYSRWLKKTKIADSKILPISFERNISLSGKTLSLQDRVWSQTHVLKKVLPVENVTIIHSPSSRYFQNQYLTEIRKPIQVVKGDYEWIFQWEISSGD